MIAEIICVGTEILLGNIVNTNATYLAQKCAEYGLSLYREQVVGDNEKRLSEVFKEALDRSDVVFLTGGLGPTKDDLTKETVCRVLGLELKEDPACTEAIRQFFEKNGRTCYAKNNKKQALIPEDGKALINKNGTAPAVLIETDLSGAKERYPHKVIVLLPGPPREVIPLTEEYLDPYFKEHSPEVIESVMLRLTGIGESRAAELLGDILDSSNPTVAPYFIPGEVHFRITSRAATKEEALERIRPVKEKIVQVLGKYIYTDQAEETLEAKVIALARQNGIMIAAAESCTGGLLSGRLVGVSGASDCFKEGFVTYANEAKMRSLGVSSEILKTQGAVSAECAMAMAEGAALKAGADLAVSTTGIAGPGGGTEEKPVGLVYIGVYFKGTVRAERYVFSGNRQIVRETAVARALNRMWQELKKL